MRSVKYITEAMFAKEGEEFAKVSLPHTWNNLDGQDGGYDYYRGKATYQMKLPHPTDGKKQFIQFNAANHIAEVFCNGQFVGRHEGGFSAFRFELTQYLKHEENYLEVTVDNNAPNIYPQQADFTFFGGLYREVAFIEVETLHFDLMKHGSDGVFITPAATGNTRIDAFLTGEKDATVKVQIYDMLGKMVAETEKQADTHLVFHMDIEAPHLWNGRKDPYLYCAKLFLVKQGEICDQIDVTYGYRSFYVDEENGFYLNGLSYPLHGVSRHQDRENKGWAITRQDHEEDMKLICEIGANTIRLAHYQQAQHFYQLCDRNGMVVWAEIPFITRFISSEIAHKNTLQQMTELIVQNYNHPSICFWGISNEITGGGESEELYQNLCELNELVKRLDPSRMTTMAHLHTMKAESPYTSITDVQGYNIYLGWYEGEAKDNGEFLDKLHKETQKHPIALSEYGADSSVCWHSAAPKNHDYTEEYQASYHETLLQCFESRPYLWATYVWNMFDFAADSRNEGGCQGRNNKGLVTYDRATKKDSFYIYKAYWTKEPMVHICGRRFVNRASGERDIKVYTNCREITLKVNGKIVETRVAKGHICLFKNVIMNSGKNSIGAVADTGVADTILLYGVDTPDLSYVLPEDAIVAGNWFDEQTGELLVLKYPEGCFSIKDTFGDIMKNPKGAEIVMELFTKMQGKPESSCGQMPKPQEDDQMRGNMAMMKNVTLYKVIKMAGQNLNPVEVVEINQRLNQICKSDNTNF